MFDSQFWQFWSSPLLWSSAGLAVGFALGALIQNKRIQDRKFPSYGNPSPVWSSFAQKLDQHTLKDFPLITAKTTMVESLLKYRYPFTQYSISPHFLQTVKSTLNGLPLALLQILYHHKIPVELDAVCEIAALMEIEKPKLHLHERFTLDGKLYDTLDNPVFPYGLTGIVLHELGHFLDWHWTSPEYGVRLSNSQEFVTALRQDIDTLPPHMRLDHATIQGETQRHGGLLHMPQSLRTACEVSLFILQEQEAFCDMVAYHMIGIARPTIAQYFPNTLQAVGNILEERFRSKTVTLAKATHGHAQ